MSYRWGGGRARALDLSSAEEVYFDLEATGLDLPQIIQFSAVGPISMGNFSKYVKPEKAISKTASDLTGITYSSGIMKANGKLVESISLQKCLDEFLAYLGDHKVILVAHNGHRFDGPLLIKSAKSCNLLKELREQIVGFLDTLHMFRSFYPNLKGTRDRPYSQASLVETILKESNEQSHDSLEDAQALKRLVQKASPSDTFKQKYIRNWEFVNRNDI